MTRQIKITKARTFELDPSKKYVMILPVEDISESDAAQINKQFERWGSECLAIMSSDPEAIRIIETRSKV